MPMTLMDRPVDNETAFRNYLALQDKNASNALLDRFGPAQEFTDFPRPGVNLPPERPGVNLPPERPGVNLPPERPGVNLPPERPGVNQSVQNNAELQQMIKTRRKLIDEEERLRAVSSDTRRQRLGQVEMELAHIDSQIKAARGVSQPQDQAASPAGYRTPFSGFGGMRMESGQEQFINPSGDIFQGSVANAPAETLVPGQVELGQLRDQELLAMDPERLAAMEAEMAERTRIFRMQRAKSPESLGSFAGGLRGETAFAQGRRSLGEARAGQERIRTERLAELTPAMTATEAASAGHKFTAKEAELNRQSAMRIAEFNAATTQGKTELGQQNRKEIIQLRASLNANQKILDEANKELTGIDAAMRLYSLMPKPSAADIAKFEAQKKRREELLQEIKNLAPQNVAGSPTSGAQALTDIVTGAAGAKIVTDEEANEFIRLNPEIANFGFSMDEIKAAIAKIHQNAI